MDRPLTDLPGWVAWLAGSVLVLALVGVVALAWVAVRTARALRRTVAEQQAALAEVERLRTLVEGGAAQQVAASHQAAAAVERAEYLITTVLTDDERAELARRTGSTDAAGPSTDAALAVRVESGRQFAAIALGESLARMVVVGHGLRRALSPESRNRAAFEMRREIRRSRRQRRDELRAARRLIQDQQRARTGGDLA